MSSLQATVISGLPEFPGHVFDEPGLAAAGRPLEHDRHARLVGRRVHFHLVVHGAIVGLVVDQVLVAVDVGHCLRRPGRRRGRMSGARGKPRSVR